MKDGLSQYDRIKRTEAIERLKVIQDGMSTWLSQAEKLSALLRYIGLDSHPDGYFDQFLHELNRIRLHQNSVPTFDGKMEPAQALMYTFLHHLDHLSTRFNTRWQQLPHWYINDILKVETELSVPDYTWITFVKNTPENVLIKKDFRFSYENADPNKKIYYSTVEDTEVNNISIEKLFSLHFEKNPDVFPANQFGSPTNVRMKNLLNGKQCSNMLFDEEGAKDSEPLGLSISSPSLLLREGKRHVTITFKSEFRGSNRYKRLKAIAFLVHNTLKEKENKITWYEAKEITLVRIFSHIFYLKVSTPDGWTPIDKYAVKNNKYELSLYFELDENFPETVSPQAEIHAKSAKFPCLKLYLNRNSWLFPYAWLKDFIIRKIGIKTQVENVSNILLYNELGNVDISKPFLPFGVTAEQHAWFVLGNYELAIKKTHMIDLNIVWAQLPRDEGGLYSYYQKYKRNIDNCSFKLRPRYLSDYRWKDTQNTEPIYLFSSVIKDKYGNPEPRCKLSDATLLNDIIIEDMEPVRLPEEEYVYSIRAKNGFVNFLLSEPEIGFGDTCYRHLFTDSLLKRTFRKKFQQQINTPINPVIERLTLSYVSDDVIDLNINSDNDDTTLSHIYPLGEEQVFPAYRNKPIPFVYSLDTEANLLIGLKNVLGDEYLTLYFDLFPQQKEINLTNLPTITWYWGNGYVWERLPDSSIKKNTTRNLISSGYIKLYLPAIRNRVLYDSNGLLWIRLGIISQEKSIPGIKKIYTHVAKVYKLADQIEFEREPDYVLNSFDQRLPGIAEIVQIVPFSGVKQIETEQDKLIRVSEYTTHRDRAVTLRDYERITLEAFPEISKVKCFSKKGTITLIIIPAYVASESANLPYASPDLLLRVEEYFKSRTSSVVTKVNVVNPVYEEVKIRCKLKLNWTNYSNAGSRAVVGKFINSFIAPWLKKNETPIIGYSFTLAELYERIARMRQVHEIEEFSVLQTIRKGKSFFIKEYTQLNDKVSPSEPYTILIPAPEHLIISGDSMGFGLNEMNMNENFVIWQNETEKP